MQHNGQTAVAGTAKCTNSFVWSWLPAMLDVANSSLDEYLT